MPGSRRSRPTRELPVRCRAQTVGPTPAPRVPPPGACERRARLSSRRGRIHPSRQQEDEAAFLARCLEVSRSDRRARRAWRRSRRRSMSALAPPRGVVAVRIAALQLAPRAGRSRSTRPRCPQAQLASSIRPTDDVRGEKVTLRADISGVITPTRSSSPTTRSSSADTGILRVVRAVDLHVQGVEEQHEEPRCRACAARSRDSATVFGSTRAESGTTPRARTSSNEVTCCGALSSSTSKSSAVRSVTAVPSTDA